MKRRLIKADTIKMLLLRSGNQCAFPNCNHPIFNDDNLLVAQLCHIEGVSPGGQRYNSTNSTDRVNRYENLMFMCYRHHKETDNVSKYSVEALTEMKNTHESKFFEKSMIVMPNMIMQIENDMLSYWSKIAQIQKSDVSGLMIEINSSSNFESVIEDIHSYLDYLEEAAGTLSFNNDNLFGEILELLDKLNIPTDQVRKIPYYENPLVNRDWELLNIGTYNAINVIRLRLKQLELKRFEEIVINNVTNTEARRSLEEAKTQLEEMVQQIGFRD